MLVGVLADSHDNVPLIERAVDYFNEEKVDFVIHAGDFVAPFAILPLAKLICPWIGVFGNNDGEKNGLTSCSRGRIQPGPYELSLDGKRVLVIHDLKSIDNDEFKQKGIELVVYGHDHRDKVTEQDGILYINPGELGGWLYEKPTVAIIDTKTLQATIKNLEE